MVNKNIQAFWWILFVSIVLLIKPVKADSSKFITAEEDTLKVGLVLSGGGALGLAHIGVIQALEEAGVRIDYITGTSMGSLVGALYAIGYTSDQLLDIARSNNFMELFTEGRNRRYITNYERTFEEKTVASFPISRSGIELPMGIITGQNVYTFLSRLAWNVHGTENFDLFPIPFAAVATDLETGKAVVFRDGYLPDALRASISLPSIFTPHVIDGRIYIDGGLIRNIPVGDALDLGANFTIAVDVSSPLMPRDSLNTLADIFTQSFYFRIQEYSEIQRNMADYLVEVDELHGRYTAADFDRVEELLQIGKRAGQKHLENFREIAAKQSNPPPPRPGVGETGSLPISQVKIQGNTIYDSEYILNQLEFEPGMYLNPDIIEQKVSRLYSSQYINNVTYRIIPNDDYEYTLQINVSENIRDEFKVGVRYETGTQASILLQSNFHNLLHDGSLTRLEARLGDRQHFLIDHLYFGVLGSRLALRTSLQYQSENVEWFSGGERVSRFKHEVLRGELSWANYFSTNNMFETGIRKDFNFHSDEINPDSIRASSEDFHAFFMRFTRDRQNRRSYPTSGEKLIVKGFLSDSFFFSPVSFSSFKFYYNSFYPVTDFMSLTNTLYAGYTTGYDLPWPFWKSPNRYDDTFGMKRFGGALRYEANSRNIQLASAGVQFEPFYHRFIGVDVYGARFLRNWDFDFSERDIEFGGSLTVGAQTILGPIKAIFSTSTLNNFRAEIQIGHQF